MISYKPFWKTMKEKKMSTYRLINEFHFSSSTFDKLRHDKGVTTAIINDLCNILECNVSDIMTHVPDKDPYRKKEKRDFDF